MISLAKKMIKAANDAQVLLCKFQTQVQVMEETNERLLWTIRNADRFTAEEFATDRVVHRRKIRA